MAAADGNEPIADDEILYRRIFYDYYQPGSDRPVSWVAFRPTEHDGDGLSVWRAKYVTLAKAGAGRPGKSYFVAVLHAEDLRRLGCDLMPTPDSGRGHASITNMSWRAYAESKNTVRSLSEMIAAQCTDRVEGPFPE